MLTGKIEIEELVDGTIRTEYRMEGAGTSKESIYAQAFAYAVECATRIIAQETKGELVVDENINKITPMGRN